MADLGTISVQLQADASGFTGTMRQATAAVRDLSDAGSASSGPLGRLAQGFERLENREGYTVLRQTALALEQVSLSSLGAEGPIGRIGAGIGLIGGGTGVGLAAMGAIALLGEEFKNFSGILDDVLPNLKEVGEQIDKARKHTDEFQHSLREMANLQAWKQFDELVQRQRLVAEQINKLQSASPSMRAFMGGEGAIDSLIKKYQELDQAITIALQTMEKLDEPPKHRQETDEARWRRFMESTIGDRRRLGFQSFDPAGTFGNLFTPAGPSGFQLPAAGRLGGSMMLPQFNTGLPTAVPSGPALPNWDTSMFPTAPRNIIPDKARKTAKDFDAIFGEEMLRVGESASKKLAEGLISGKANMANIGKELATELTSGLIDTAFTLAKTSFIQSLTREAATVAGAAGFLFP